MYRSFSLLSLVCAVLIALGLLTTETNAQKKSKPSAKTASKADKRSDAKSDKKSARDSKDKKTADAKSRNNSKDKKQADARSKNKKDDSQARSKSDARNSKDKKREDKKQADKISDKKRDDRLADRKNDKKSDDKKDRKSDNKRGKKESLAERRERERREAEARREAERREAERRAAIEAERRERERKRQEAIARARAFEKGLRDETVANILKDDLSGEDMEVRRAAISALGERAGTVVVMDAQNGRVVSMVNQEWAMRKGFKPCSTVKLVTGVAGVNEKVIDEAGEITTASSPLNLSDALAYSNNTYFQKVGGSVGYEKMMKYSRELGLGAPTGINLPNESAGKLPEPKSGFALNRMSSHGDDFEVTPIQLAVEVTAIANGGKILKPQVVRNQQEQISFIPKAQRQVNVPNATLRAALPGMMGAVGYGTARRAKDDSLNIAGKTGSCIGQGSWLGLFASIAPVQNPKYAVVVVTRGQAARGKWAAEVAGKVYQALGSRIRAAAPPQPMIATRQPIVVPPRPKVDPNTAACLSVEEEGTDEEAQADAEGGDFVNGKSAGKSGKFDPRNSNVNKALPTVNDNKVKTINKIYPRGNPPAANQQPIIVGNSSKTPAPAAQPSNTAPRRPRVVQNPQ